VEALQVRYHLPEGWRWTTLYEFVLNIVHNRAILMVV
jgi:hypothetical protein